MDEEDEEQETQRLAEEQRDKEDVETLLGTMDKSWMEKKTRTREKEDVKKRRMTVVDNNDGEQKPKKRMRRMQYTLLKEDWGDVEEGGCDSKEDLVAPILCDVSTPLPTPGGVKRKRCSRRMFRTRANVPFKRGTIMVLRSWNAGLVVL